MSTLLSVVKAFNPLGPLAEAYAKTLTYRIETKRLASEAKRIQDETRTTNRLIDKTYQLKMEDLRQRRLVLERTFDLAEQAMHQLHIERMKVLEMVQLAHSRALDSDASMEERHLFKDLATEMAKQLPTFGEKASQSLDSLVRALPPINMPAGLLESHE